MRRGPFAVVGGAALLASTAGCGSGNDAVCLSSDVAEVCADGGDGGVVFSGSGLEPGSEVRMENDQVGPVVLVVGADGSLGPDGSVGLVSLFADTEFTFTVAAIDDQGDPIVGDITVST